VVQISTKDRKHHITHVIISGGEPMLWSKELSDLTGALMVTGFHVTIETNGTKYVEIPTKHEKRDLINNILFSISPKLKSSVPTGTTHEKSHNKARINEVVLAELLKRYPSYLKFVVTGPEDLEEVTEIQGALKLPNHRIFLMPEGITQDEIRIRSQVINELCMKHNYRYSPREHINIYGHKRRT
jgi:7-carboxy-7-deazaguanine synthase